jgi:hypothetical protein
VNRGLLRRRTRIALTAPAQRTCLRQSPAVGLRFVPLTPCRLVDTRAAYAGSRTGAFGPPLLSAGTVRTISIPSSTTCSVPSTAKAYVFNVTLDTIENQTGPVDFVTLWPTGQPRPDFFTARTTTGGTLRPLQRVAGYGASLSDECLCRAERCQHAVSQHVAVWHALAQYLATECVSGTDAGQLRNRPGVNKWLHRCACRRFYPYRARSQRIFRSIVRSIVVNVSASVVAFK